MACLLKLPLSSSKGVVTFTTQEWRRIQSSSDLLQELAKLRDIYVIGLHFNWHDYQFSPPPQFDFFMAGEEDLRPIDDKPYRLLSMDACNFTPSAYFPAGAESKFWDVLIVGNPVFFKRPEIALRTIRDLFDKSEKPLRVLYICPIPEHRFFDEATVLYGIREYYEALFTIEERTRFTLLTTNFDSPNPFDRTTLSVFFRNSKVFLHCATEERRCRIAAYAWCAGLPVVAYPSVASILPQALRQSPGYYAVTDDNQYADALINALTNASSFDAGAYHEELSEIKTTAKLELKLADIFLDLNIPFEGSLLSQNLDRRLGWHHQGIGGVANGLQQSLQEFMITISTLDGLDAKLFQRMVNHEYPERVLANECDSAAHLDTAKVEHDLIYLNANKRKWLNLAKHIKTRIFG
ncbi:MAG: hypothetical protein ACTHJ1_13385 [Bordetella sp.]|uniref:hypothetical protein n=1 Tax=Bordetella sp. TaxID=28081 RepID=UPI003F7C1EF5